MANIITTESKLLPYSKSLLEQDKSLLLEIIQRGVADFYTKGVAPYGSTVGQNMRHLLEEYDLVFNAKKTGVVDYRKLERLSPEYIKPDEEILIETLPSYAITKIDSIIDVLDSLDLSTFEDKDTPVYLPFDPNVEYSSSFHRELAYANAHAIHHKGSLTLMLHNSLGFNMDKYVQDGYGINASTIRTGETVPEKITK